MNSRQNIGDHFVDVNKMVKLGSGSERQIEDIEILVPFGNLALQVFLFLRLKVSLDNIN